MSLQKSIISFDIMRTGGAFHVALAMHGGLCGSNRLHCLHSQPASQISERRGGLK